MLAVLAVRHVQDEEGGNQLHAGSRPEDLQRRTKNVRRRVAGARDHAVRVVCLDHHHTEGQRIIQQPLSRLLQRHSLLLPGLVEKLRIFLKLLRLVRIDNLNSCQIHLQPARAVHDLLFIAHHDDVGNSLLKHMSRGDQRSLVIRFGHDNGFLILSGLFLDDINVRHFSTPFRTFCPFVFCLSLIKIITEFSIVYKFLFLILLHKILHKPQFSRFSVSCGRHFALKIRGSPSASVQIAAFML